MQSVEEIRLRTAGCLGSKRVFVSSDCSVKQSVVRLFHMTHKMRGKTLHVLSLSLSFYLSVLSLLDG